MSSSMSPFFCKIIVEDTIRLNKLRFPRKFVRKHGSELSSPVRLTVPDGVTFPVEVAKSDDGQVWLENGWKQFSEHYCLKNGYYLVFEYEGNCSFQVLLFDLSAAAIDHYPYISDSDDGGDEECQQPNMEEEEAKDDTSSEVLNPTPPHSETSERHRPRKKRRKTTSEYVSDSDDGGEEDCQQPNREEGEVEHSSFAEVLNQTSPESKTGERHCSGLEPCEGRGKGMGNGWECPEQAVILRFQGMTAEEKAKTLWIANEFNSKNPFFLSVILSFNDSSYMSIPNKFAKKFLAKTHESKAILCLSDEKSWSVDFHWRGSQEDPKARFSTGWKKFALDNRLVAGDICVFELLEGAKITLKVVIHRVADVANCDTSQGLEFYERSINLTLQVPEAADSRLASNIPLFEKYVKPSSVDHHRRMNIPFKFIEKHFKPNTRNVILQVADRLWSVKLLVYKHNRTVHMTSGWRKFAEENSLKVGDVCVFRLITTSNDAMLNVSISRSGS